MKNIKEAAVNLTKVRVDEFNPLIIETHEDCVLGDPVDGFVLFATIHEHGVSVDVAVPSGDYCVIMAEQLARLLGELYQCELCSLGLFAPSTDEPSKRAAQRH